MKLSTVCIDIIPAIALCVLLVFLGYNKLARVQQAVEQVEQLQTEVDNLGNKCTLIECVRRALK